MSDRTQTPEVRLRGPRDNEIVSSITGVLYPFIIVFATYVILNGHNTPGGGFQGGAILATLFLARFIVEPRNDLDVHATHNLEKVLFAILLLVPTAFVFAGLQGSYPQLQVPYLVFMNVFIGLKVAFGLTIVVFRFGFYDKK